MHTSDEELVARALGARDKAAFGELVRRHQSRLRGWLRQLTRSAAAADDIAQEAFIRAWERLDSFGGQGRFAAWLMKIAYNEFLMAYRRERSAGRLAAAVGAELAAEPAVHDPAGDEAAATDLERLLAVLDEEERVAMVLCYAQGLSHGEASEVTGWPVGTVKSHIHRGKEKIRRRFFPEESRHDA
jgi:RNA polymerase sigma-70 factor (ECF subfamily)